MYTIDQKLFITGLFVLFVTVVIGGVFVSQVAVLWLRNKREERKHYERRLEIRCSDKWDEERENWMGMIDDRDKEITKLLKNIDELKDELSRTNTNYNNAKKLIDHKNLKGETI